MDRGEGRRTAGGVAAGHASSGMNKRHAVRLAECERAALRQRVSAGHGRARDLLHARILLKADSGPEGPAWTDDDIAAALDVGRSTVERVRKRFAVFAYIAGSRHRSASSMIRGPLIRVGADSSTRSAP